MKKSVRNTLDAPAMELLQALCGSTLHRIQGANLHERLIGQDVTIVCDRSTVTIWGQVDDLEDWEGFDGQYAVIHVVAGVPDIYFSADSALKAEAEGNVYYFHSGESVEQVRLLRETVVKVVDGETQWEYVTDIAIAFVLSGGVLVVSKMALDGEMLRVTFHESVEEVAVVPPAAFWFHWNVLGTEFTRSTDWLDIGKGLKE